MLRRALIATTAACTALGRPVGRDAFALTLQSALPDIVRRVVRPSVLLAAHGAAWQMISVPESDPHRTLLRVSDPVRRAALALNLPGLRPEFRVSAITGALRALEAPHAAMLAWQLATPLADRDDIPATALETVVDIVRRITEGGATVRGYGAQRQWITDLRHMLAQSPLGQRDADFVYGALLTAYQQQLPAVSQQGLSILEGWVQDHLSFWHDCRAALATEAA
jgi:hypothetical protein